MPHRANPSRPPSAPELVALGAAARFLRARYACSQERLGLNAGLHRNYVGAIERAEVNPTYLTLRRLASGLDVPLSELVLHAETTYCP